jgi:GNAT superfamily N-acetyltransferase
MSHPNIRKAQESDAQAIAQILRDLGWFVWVNSTSEETTVAQIQQQITECQESDSHSIYVAENAESNVIGYVTVHWLLCPFLPKLQGYVSELFVLDGNRGQGIGKSLLAAVIREAKIRECLWLMLLNHKERESYQRQFYRKQGWIEREFIANFIYPLNAGSP